MAKWKLCRQTFGTETFTFSEGQEVTLGRGLDNTITLTSLVISRSHCVINIQKDQLLITDLNSSNGVYVGTKRIEANIPHAIKDSDTIGIGWTTDVPLGKIQDSEKYIFKVVRERQPSTLINGIVFQNDDVYENIEQQIAKLDSSNPDVKPVLKRKISNEFNSMLPAKIIKKPLDICNDDQVISILSDSDTELNMKLKNDPVKNPKLEPVLEEPLKLCNNQNVVNIKTEKEYLEFEAFNVKQEYIGYDDEAICIDSDSDSESEHWFLRLSQSSPGKPFTMLRDKSGESKPEDSSYSQMDDDLGCNAFLGNENDYLDDPVSLVGQPQDVLEDLPAVKLNLEGQKEISSNSTKVAYDTNFTNLSKIEKIKNDQLSIPIADNEKDEVDGFSSKEVHIISTTVTEIEPTIITKKVQMIEPLNQMPRRKINQITPERKTKSSSSKHDKKSKHSTKKHNVSITSSRKEERKRRLKEIAQKGKGDPTETLKEESENISSKDTPDVIDVPSSKMNSSKSTSNVKVTSSNRQAFLTEDVKPAKKKDNSHRSTGSKGKKESSSPKEKAKVKSSVQSDNIENSKTLTIKTEQKESKSKSNNIKCDSKNVATTTNAIVSEPRGSLKSLKALVATENTKVHPQPEKKKKKVHFSEQQPQIKYFEIADGNRMTKTSLVKNTLVDIRQTPIFSLEKITLMKILRWNPHWLEEQINNNEPPPILGHSNPPLAIFHSFSSHNQYVQLIGDLLLMEIWECLSIAYTKIRNQSNKLRMVIASLPPVPTQERHFDIFNLSVDISLPTTEIKSLPRVGEILLVTFGPENSRYQRFFFVHNVRTLPSPPSNRNSFYNISLHATFSDKMRLLKPGEVMIGISLAYINKELSLFEAMAYMAGSPLSEAILRPEPRHFVRHQNHPAISMTSQWTMTLNPSQQVAVASSVSAALGDQPCIQMVQGPPGTGKSSVICAIVMSYFYDPNGKKLQNRGKILICATSNAAVDELVIRLLNIRQNLPTAERFRMVRVGRAEAMHARARDVSSQQLAQRDAARLLDAPLRPGLAEEIAHIEAKINMWKTGAQDAAAKGQDPMRVAYCRGRISDLVKRIALLRSGGGGGGGDAVRPEQLLAAERRIIEGADIVVTTLASAHNHKMRGLKRRIALCIVDEAGQAIEPETLIPLTLDVTKLTLIGDPQQLPGYICSQRAKKHGLGESLFSRLAGSAGCAAGGGGGGPAVLLSQQYRMHEHIADYPNRAFYAGLVASRPPPRPPLPVPPYAILGISSGDKGQNSSGANEMEAWGVARLVTALSAMLRGQNLSLAVITPYNAHKDLIKKNLKILMDPAEAPVEVNTVDSFQGQERDVMVVSLARSHGVGFLTDAGRMNVMLTRARHALLVCLNPHAVLKNHQWRTLLEDAQKRKLYRTLPYKMCQATCQISKDEIIRHVKM